MANATFRQPLSKALTTEKLMALGLDENESRLLTAPLSSIVKDKEMMSRADKAWEKRNALIQKSNDEVTKEKSGGKVKLKAPAVHTYETT